MQAFKDASLGSDQSILSVFTWCAAYFMMAIEMCGGAMIGELVVGKAYMVRSVVSMGLAAVLLGTVNVHAAKPQDDPQWVLQRLGSMMEQLDEAAKQARGARRARNIDTLKTRVDAALSAVWGIESGIDQSHDGAADLHGWKTRWQTNLADFDPAYGERYGDMPAKITDPEALGVVGLGRDLRRRTTQHAPAGMIESVNNVIGWMRLDDGVTKAERQPRIDLTYRWDADKAFWQSDADTGWIFRVQAQALNILKFDYGKDLKLARVHARDLLALIDDCREGVDADGDGEVQPIAMEGGLKQALRLARKAVQS